MASTEFPRDLFSHIENVVRPDTHADYAGKWFKVSFQLAANAPQGQYQIALRENHRTEVLYNESSRLFYTSFFLPYNDLQDTTIQLWYNDRCDKEVEFNINDCLPKVGSELSYTEQYAMPLTSEMKKNSINFTIFVQLHNLNYNPLSYTTFDLIADLKPTSRFGFLDKIDYVRAFIYVTSKQYEKFIAEKQELIPEVETLHSFQQEGYLIYITQMTEEPTKTVQFPFIEFDTSLLQYAADPVKTLEAVHKGTFLDTLPILGFDDAVHIKIQLRNDKDEVLAVALETLPSLVQPFASMQRTSARELPPITSQLIGSNHMQQKLIYNHFMLNSHEKLDEPSVSQFRRSRGSKSSTKQSRLELDEPKWNPPEDISTQTQCHVLKPAIMNPTVPQVIIQDANTRDTTIKSSRKATKEDKNDDEGLVRKKYGPNESPLWDITPSFFSSKGDIKQNKPKQRGSIHILALAHYHFPTMKEAFAKNPLVLRPSIVMDFYSDENKKPELDKTLDILNNVMTRLEPYFTFRKASHTQGEVDQFFNDLYQQFGKASLIDPETDLPNPDQYREVESGEPYLLRNLEAAGIPITFLNTSPPPNLVPIRDLGSTPQYQDKWAQLKDYLAEKHPQKMLLQRYEFANFVKAGNNAFPTPNAQTSGINRRGVASCDNEFHHQVIRDGVRSDEYSCEVYDVRRAHPLLNLNLAQITPYCDYPLSAESAIYYCRALRHRVRSSQLQLPPDYQQRKQDKMNGKMKANDNNTGVGGQSMFTFFQEFARELITRSLIEVESKLYSGAPIEYSVVFVGGYRCQEEDKVRLQKMLREYFSMLPVSFVFIEYTETTSQREESGQTHTNGGSWLDKNAVNILNESGMISSTAPKCFAVHNHAELSFPSYTYDRRNLRKLQQEYQYPQRDIIISLRKTWFLDKDTTVYDYTKLVVPHIKARLAIQIKQYLDIQYKSRATFETMSMILYPSMSGVQSNFALQSKAPMGIKTQCGFYQMFFQTQESIDQGGDNCTKNGKTDIGDEKKAHRKHTVEQEKKWLQDGKCPHCQVYDTEWKQGIDLFYEQTQKLSEEHDQKINIKIAPYRQQTFTASLTEENESQSFSLVNTSHVNELPPPFMDDIVDTSKFNIKLDHIANAATVRDTTNSMQWHIENLALKIAQFKEQQGL